MTGVFEGWSPQSFILSWAVCFACVFCVIPTALGAAQSDRQPITIEDVVSSPLPAVFSLRWLSDDQLVSQTSADLFAYWSGEGAVGSVLTLPIDGAAPQSVADGRLVSFSTSGDRYASLIEGVWTVTDVRTGARTPLSLSGLSPDTIGPRPSAPPVWSADDRYIALSRLFSIFPDASSPPSGDINGDPRVIDVGAIADASTKPFSEIILIDTYHPERAPKQVRVEGSVVELSWGLDQDLYFVGRASSVPPSLKGARSLLRWSTGEDTVETVISLEGGILPYVEISPDGRYAALVADLDTGVGGVFYSLFTVDLHDQTLKRLTQTVRVAQEYVWGKASDRIYFPARIGGLDQIFEVNIAGRLQTIGGGPRRHSLIDVSPSGELISYYTEDVHGRRDVRVFDLEAGEERIVQTISDPKNDYRLGDVEAISWASGEGFDVHGLLVFPPDYDPARAYPLLVDVHGGGPGVPILLMAPLTSGVVQGPLEWHASAAKGYIVFVPDFRSSGDYGPQPDRIRRVEGDYAFIEADVCDILAGVEAVRARFKIDHARVGVLGHSAGGARVNRLLQATDLFFAGILNEAITGDALSTLIYLATGSRTGNGFEEVLSRSHGGRLADQFERYTAQFVFDGYKNTTPTLIMVGGNSDLLAVPPMASELLFSTLREYGVPVRMLRFVEEGHNYRDPEIAILAFNEMHSWLEDHMSEATD